LKRGSELLAGSAVDGLAEVETVAGAIAKVLDKA
jgi:hypothetical protein